MHQTFLTYLLPTILNYWASLEYVKLISEKVEHHRQHPLVIQKRNNPGNILRHRYIHSISNNGIEISAITSALAHMHPPVEKGTGPDPRAPVSSVQTLLACGQDSERRRHKKSARRTTWCSCEINTLFYRHSKKWFSRASAWVSEENENTWKTAKYLWCYKCTATEESEWRS